MHTCIACGAIVTEKDCYCDGIICEKGHMVLARQCNGKCDYCTDDEREQYIADAKDWLEGRDDRFIGKTFESEHIRAERWRETAIATDEDYQKEVKKNLKLADEKRIWWEQYNKAVEALAREYDIKVELLRRIEELECDNAAWKSGWKEQEKEISRLEGELVVAQETLRECGQIDYHKNITISDLKLEIENMKDDMLEKSRNVEVQVAKIEEAACLLDRIAGELQG